MTDEENLCPTTFDGHKHAFGTVIEDYATTCACGNVSLWRDDQVIHAVAYGQSMTVRPRPDEVFTPGMTLASVATSFWMEIMEAALPKVPVESNMADYMVPPDWLKP